LLMIKGKNEIEKLNVTRQMIGTCEYDPVYDLPIITKTDLSRLDLENLHLCGVQNLSVKRNNHNTLVHMFRYDCELHAYWNNPLKKIPLFRTCAAISTPDFSVTPDMNINEMRHNVFKGRWLGKLWQNYGCVVIPTVGWADPCTYDLCFSGIEVSSPVIISTIGCKENKEVFLEGFSAMKKRIRPELIFVYGDMVQGMTGTFVNFTYTDAFSKKYEQLRLTGISQIFTVEGD